MTTPPPPLPRPPYPPPEHPAFVEVLKQAIGQFEAGQVSVAGAIMQAAQMGWAIGHQEGEDLCPGCTARALTLPQRSAPHLRCLTLSLLLIEQSVKSYVETWTTLCKAGYYKLPTTEDEMRAAFKGIEAALEILRLFAAKGVSA